MGAFGTRLANDCLWNEGTSHEKESCGPRAAHLNSAERRQQSSSLSSIHMTDIEHHFPYEVTRQMKMHMFSSSLLSFAVFCAFSLASTDIQSPLGGLKLKHTLRPATETDLDDVVDTFITAFRSGAMWQYVHIDDEKYANYTWTCTREALQEGWENLDDSDFVNVISIPDDSDRAGGGNERVVSFAVWAWLDPEDSEFPLFTSELHRTHGKCSDNLDVNITRLNDLNMQSDNFTNPVSGNLTEPQLYLALIATHPNWDGHGFGAEQVEIGLKKAAHANMPVTLISTPAGYPLYNSLGFSSVENQTFEMLDGLGSLWMEYMHWDADQP